MFMYVLLTPRLIMLIKIQNEGVLVQESGKNLRFCHIKLHHNKTYSLIYYFSYLILVGHITCEPVYIDIVPEQLILC